MKLASILDEWDKDCEIDNTDLSNESLKVPKLFSKWLRVLTVERMILIRMQSEFEILEKDKWVFITDGPTEETQKLGWKLPPKGKILKANKDEVKMYVATDPDIIILSLKIGNQLEKVEALERIVTSLQSKTGFSQRTTQIKNSIDHLKWVQG